ncbi:nucleoid-associated protein [Chitinimonas koreensis]|uniref:nucleoid-associated protein n=1 Tax=Chitinimonas koreensis TaxID=356302 RepID=UPI000422AA0F|nr:nucleoid-associated protein [Chitinimonas koreensis]QNM95240.1 nucleoid-associated protein [Chitinimonas koreensis]
MTPFQHTIADLVVHKLIKDQHGPAAIELHAGPMPLTPSAQRLVDQLCQHYAERLGKGYGRFEDDEDNFPMARFVRQHVIEQRIDFATLAQLMMQHLQVRAEQEQLASGGYVLIARVHNGASDCLLVALVTETVGSAITAGLEIVDQPHLDLASLRVAGRIDLTAWQRGAERYISFLKGRADVAQYFKLFLGCNDVVIALKETQKLVQGLGRFAEAQKLEPEARDQLMERAHGYLDALGGEGEPLSLDAAAEQLWPDAPERLRGAFGDEALELAGGFVPDRRAIKPLVRFKASAPKWKVEFDRSSLRSGAVIYDKHSDTLVLYDVPEHLKRALLEE